MVLLLFAGFFRFNELAALAIQDMSISETHLTVKVTKSKTDQYRKGNEVVISRSGKVFCPVLSLEIYMALPSISTPHKTSDYLFKPLVKVRSGNKVIEKVKPLSYTRARESIVGLLSKFVPTTDIISLHSFRAGDATSAANAQVPDRCLKRHGRWQSETAKDGYVEDSLDNRLLVSQSLGIWFDFTDIPVPVLCISIQCSSQFPYLTSDKLCFYLLSIRGNRGNLLFAAVRRIAANRCFHGSPVFWQFSWRRKYYKGGILLIWAILCWRRCQLAFVSRFFINVVMICFVTLYLLAFSPLTLGVFGRVQVSSKKGVFPDGQQAHYRYLYFC